MLTVTFASVLAGVFHKAGLDPDDASDPDKLAVIEAIADRYKTAAEYYRWPLLLDIEERFFRPLWDAAETYAEDDEVYFEDEDKYYVALATTSAAQSPTTNPEKWEELTEFNHQVDYEQDGETPIAAVLGAWDEDPRSSSSALELGWKIRQGGVGFSPDVNVTSVWLEYRPRAADFAAVLYDETEEYAVGDIVYFPEIGDVYTCAEATSAAQTPETDADKWTIVEFPEFLARAVKAGAYSDWLTGDERPQASNVWEAKFTELLEEQVWQLTKLQGQTGSPTVSPAR